jgi:hypothetical protein
MKNPGQVILEVADHLHERRIRCLRPTTVGEKGRLDSRLSRLFDGLRREGPTFGPVTRASS